MLNRLCDIQLAVLRCVSYGGTHPARGLRTLHEGRDCLLYADWSSSTDHLAHTRLSRNDPMLRIRGVFASK
eukprot:9495153-Pyramimonas_sp.AAC.1